MGNKNSWQNDNQSRGKNSKFVNTLVDKIINNIEDRMIDRLEDRMAI